MMSSLEYLVRVFVDQRMMSQTWIIEISLDISGNECIVVHSLRQSPKMIAMMLLMMTMMIRLHALLMRDHINSVRYKRLVNTVEDLKSTYQSIIVVELQW